MLEIFCQTPDLGRGLGVDFTFAPLHISPATLAHLHGNPHINCSQTPDFGLRLGVDFTFARDNNNNNNNINNNNNNNNKIPHLNFLKLRDKGHGEGSGERDKGSTDKGIKG